jgi:tetratricopeptide (TPR) repeat protein
MDKVEVVTELRIRRELAKQIRNELVRDLQDHCRPHTELNEVSLCGWELRKHAPDRVHAKALCAYFDVDAVAKLGLGWDDEADSYWTWATKAEKRLEVERRLLLRRGVELGVALLPVGPLTALAQRLGGRLRIGLGDVQHAERIATHLAVEYFAKSNAETVRAAVAHARTLTDRLRNADSLANSTVRTRLTAVTSDAAALAGYTYVEAGCNGEARWWFDEALGLAREADDRRLEALGLTMIALTAWPACKRLPGGGRPVEALDALQAAAGLDRYLPPAGRALAHAQLSAELALANEDASSGQALERMLSAAARVGRDDAGWGYWSQQAALSGWADTPRTIVYSGLRPYYLGRYRDAIRIFEEAIKGTALPVRRALIQLDLTGARAELDDPDGASVAGIAALDEVAGQDLESIRAALFRLRDGWGGKWDDLECMRALDERLATG